MNEHKQQQSIEKYLRDEMSAVERERFEHSIASDPVLASEVRLQRLLQEEFEDREKQDFIKEVEAIGDRYFRGNPDSSGMRWKWGYWLGGGILLAGILIFWLLSVPPPTVTDQQDRDISVPASPMEETSPPVIEPEESVPTAEPEPTPTTPPAPRQESTVERPIAQVDPADLTPNPYLENLIGGNIRGIELQFFSITARFDQQEFKLEGQIKKQISENALLVVFVYTNKEKDFLDGNYLARFPLDLKLLPAGETERTDTGVELQSFRFSVTQGIDWKPGLYYYFLAWETEAEPLYTGKIQLPAN